MRQLSPFHRFLVFLFLGAVFVFSFNQLKESDSFYHLKVGQVVWETGTVPHTDIFSSPARGAPWVTHEWLAELIFYGVYSLGGLTGLPQSGFWWLAAFVAALAALTYYFIIFTALRVFSSSAARRVSPTGVGTHIYITLAVAGILGYFTFELWIPRPQVFAFLFLAALIFCLEEFRNSSVLESGSGSGTDRRRRALFAAILIVWAWANMHASVILGIVVMLVYALVELIKMRWRWLGEGVPREQARILAGAALAATLISFVNPNGYRIFLYRPRVESAVRQLGILEWKSIFDFVYQWQAVAFLALLACSLGLIIWRYWIRRERRDATVIVVAVAVAVLPILSIRHVGWWPIIAIAPVSAALSDAWGSRLMRVHPRYLRRAALAALAVFLSIAFARFPDVPIRRDLLPVDAADFIEAHHLRGPIFNLYNEGGYLIWRLWPREKVFMDGRSEVFEGAPIADLMKIVGRREGWDELVRGKYRINLAILPYRPDSLAKDTGPLSFELMMRGFHLVYWDDVAMLLVRENFRTKRFVDEFGLRVIHPFRDPNSIPHEERRAAGEEIQKILARAPESQAVQAYAQRFLENR